MRALLGPAPSGATDDVTKTYVDTAAGSRLCWKGAWSNLAAYAVNDVVTYNGRLYLFTSAVAAYTGSSLTYRGSVTGATFGTTALGNLALPAGCVAGDTAYLHVGIAYTSGITLSALKAPTGASGAATQLFAQLQTAPTSGDTILNSLFGYILTATDISNGYLTVPAQAPASGSAQTRVELLVVHGASLTVTGSATNAVNGSASQAITLPSVTPSAQSNLGLYLVDSVNFTSTSGTQAQAMSPTVTQFVGNNAPASGSPGTQSATGFLNITGLTSMPAETYTGGPMSTGSGLGGVAGVTIALAVDPTAGNPWDTSKVVEIGVIHDSITGTLQASDPINSADLATRNYVDAGDMGAENYAASLWADTGQLSSGFTATSPHTINSQSVRKVGKIVQCQVSFTLGAAISVPASGDIGNTEVATIAAAYRPLGAAAMANAGTGQMIHGQCGTTGSIQVTSVPNGATLASGTALQLAGTWLAA